jgi:glutamate synthase domain-containing protein 2
VGLADDVVDRCFTGTTSRIQGADFGALYADIVKFHEAAYPSNSSSELLLGLVWTAVLLWGDRVCVRGKEEREEHP